MKTPNDVLITGERHLIIHGQLGNLSAKLDRVRQACEDYDQPDAVKLVGDVIDELRYLRNYYPQLDGGIHPVGAGPRRVEGFSNSPLINKSLDESRLRSHLLDMRALIDAASVNYAHDGTIICRLKAMFDYAWQEAADLSGISRDELDDIPF